MERPVYSEIPLDLGFPARHSHRRTERRTPTGTDQRTSAVHLRVGDEDNGDGARGGSGPGRGREATTSGTDPRATGGTGETESAGTFRGTPTTSVREGRQASGVDTGNRVSVNGARCQRGRFAGRPGRHPMTGSVRRRRQRGHRRRETGAGAGRQRSRLRPVDRVSDSGIGAGSPSPPPEDRSVRFAGSGGRTGRTGSPGRPDTYGHRPPRSPQGATTGDVIGRAAG